MLEGTNQSSHVDNNLLVLVSRNAYTLAGNPTDWITLVYSVTTLGHHMPRYTKFKAIISKIEEHFRTAEPLCGLAHFTLSWHMKSRY